MLNEKQLKAVWMLAQGWNNKAIAKECKVSENTVSNWRKTDEFKKEYDKAIHEIFTQLASEAVNTIADLMRNSSNPTVRLNASKDILSRGGFDATAKSKVEVENTTINVNITDE